MLLSEALVLLKSGDSMTRDSWGENDGYVVLMKGMKHVWKIIVTMNGTPAPNAGNHIFTVDELCADDWSVYDGDKFKKQVATEIDPA